MHRAYLIAATRWVSAGEPVALPDGAPAAIRPDADFDDAAGLDAPQPAAMTPRSAAAAQIASACVRVRVEVGSGIGSSLLGVSRASEERRRETPLNRP